MSDRLLPQAGLVAPTGAPMVCWPSDSAAYLDAAYGTAGSPGLQTLDPSSSTLSPELMHFVQQQQQQHQQNNPNNGLMAMDEDQPCTICGDRATGKHYGAHSCDGCKGFFRRSIRKKQQYVCRGKKVCEINKEKRNQCRSCRLMRCLRAGMRKDAVQTERDKISNRKSPFADLDSSDGIGLGLVVNAEKCIQDIQIKDNVPSSTTPVATSSSSTGETVTSSDTSILTCGSASPRREATKADICAAIRHQLRLLIQWASQLPCFCNLDTHERLHVLKARAGELLILGAIWRTLVHLPSAVAVPEQNQLLDQDVLLLANDCILTRNNQDPEVYEVFRVVMDEVLQPLRRVGLDQGEYAALKAIAFLDPTIRDLSPGASLEFYKCRHLLQTDLMNHMNEKEYGQSLQGRFGAVLLLLPNLARASALLMVANVDAELVKQLDKGCGNNGCLLVGGRNGHGKVNHMLRDWVADALGAALAECEQQPPKLHRQENRNTSTSQRQHAHTTKSHAKEEKPPNRRSAPVPISQAAQQFIVPSVTESTSHLQQQQQQPSGHFLIPGSSNAEAPLIYSPQGLVSSPNYLTFICQQQQQHYSRVLDSQSPQHQGTTFGHPQLLSSYGPMASRATSDRQHFISAETAAMVASLDPSNYFSTNAHTLNAFHQQEAFQQYEVHPSAYSSALLQHPQGTPYSAFSGNGEGHVSQHHAQHHLMAMMVPDSSVLEANGIVKLEPAGIANGNMVIGLQLQQPGISGASSSEESGAAPVYVESDPHQQVRGSLETAFSAIPSPRPPALFHHLDSRS